jgi:hypothetical protein
VHDGFADASVYLDIVVMFGLASEINGDLSHSHIDGEAAEVQVAEVQAGFSGAEVHIEVERDFLAKAQVPGAFVMTHARIVGWRANFEMATEAALVIADLGFAEGAVVVELAIKKLAGPASGPKLTSAHLKFDSDHFGFAASDVLRFMPVRPSRFEPLDTSRKPEYTRKREQLRQCG